MSNIFIIHNNGIFGEEDIVAVFNDKEQADGFINRNPSVIGGYKIEEKVLNPVFVRSKQLPFRVMINPQGEEPPISVMPIELFDEEGDANQRKVNKVDDAFHMCLFANNSDDAEQIATKKLEELKENGAWELIPDIATA